MTVLSHDNQACYAFAEVTDETNKAFKYVIMEVFLKGRKVMFGEVRLSGLFY